MSIEIEAKMALDDPEPLRRRLLRVGARPMGCIRETNIFFDDADRTLKAADHGLRLRINESMQDPAAATARPGREVTLTHKGPRQPGPLKRRSETEIRIDDPDAATRLLAALGYRPVLTFEKHRERYFLGRCEIALDHLPWLGHFIEIEGPGESAVMDVRRRLGLEDLPLITASYIAMLADCAAQHGLSVSHIHLDDPAPTAP